MIPIPIAVEIWGPGDRGARRDLYLCGIALNVRADQKPQALLFRRSPSGAGGRSVPRGSAVLRVRLPFCRPADQVRDWGAELLIGQVGSKRKPAAILECVQIVVR